MRRFARRIASACFDPLVVVTMMTTFALIVGVLTYVSPVLGRKGVALCAAIGIVGLIATTLQIRKILGRQSLREELGGLFYEGQQLLVRCLNP